MKLRGNRILLNRPEIKESAIELSEKDKALVEAELRKSWSHLEVFQVGEAVESIKANDQVYVRITALELAEKIEIDYLVEKERTIAKYYTERFIDYMSFNQSLFPEYNANVNEDIYPDRDSRPASWVL